MALRIAKWVGIVVAGLVALVALLVLGLNTSPGRRFLVDRIAAYQTASGITVRIGRIDGSLYGRMRITDLSVRDLRGEFLSAPELTVDWRPFAYLRSHVDVRELLAPSIRLARLPELKPTPTDPDAPTLPDIDVTVGKVAIGRFQLDAPVTGKRQILRIAGSAEIADGRAIIAADAAATAGDRLVLKLDAVPDRNRFGLTARLSAPVGGVLDGYAGLGKPIVATVDGQGDWADWKGALKAQAGGQPLADLAITGRSGTFRTLGTLAPSAVLAGPAARLTEPAIRLDLTTALAERRATVTLKARSDALVLDAGGVVDLAASRLGQFRIAGQLLTPGAIAEGAAGRDIALTAVLDGPFATPTIDYRLSAAAASFGATGIRGLVAQGRAVIDTDRIRIPVHASARAVTGLNAAAGDILTDLRVDGDLAYQNGQLASDNLRLRSRRIDATAIILADLGRGTYTGALKGRVNDYQVNGLGRIDLTTDARLVPGRNGGFGVAGHVRILTRRLDNASLRDQLGGNALIDADVGYDLDGGARLTNLRLRAPRFRITGGEGRYTLDGRIAFRAVGASSQYGPFSLTVRGTVARPVAELRAARPNVGVQLTDVVATLEGTAAGYRIRARGGSDYGPFDADLVIRTGRGPLTVDIASATFAGIRFAGTVSQTAAGPFAGTLTLAGSGLNGSVRLAAVGSVQQAVVDVRASAARIPGSVPITIGQGTVQATILLPPAGPTVQGGFDLVDVRRGETLVSRARGRIDYRNGAGKVALVANGRSGVPFQIATQAELSPTRVLANATGAVNGLAFRLARPAVATKQGADWVLQPATIVLPQGQVDISGRYGSATSVRAALRNLDVSIAQMFVPGLGLGGKATGTIDYAASGTVPNLRARIDVANFTRTAALTVSEPVDIALLATLGDPGADVRALIRRRGATVGRLQARMAPLAAGAALSDRLLRAPLSGGIRYNGPAEVLWALGGIPRQTLSGPLAIGADFGGTAEHPSVTGVVRANALRYENESFGTVLSQIAIDGRFDRARFELTRLTARAGKGTVSASGTVGLDAAAGYPIALTAQLADAQLARSDALGATVSGNIRITNDKADGGLIKGDLTIPEARYQIVTQAAAAVPELTGVRRKGDAPVAADQPAALPSRWALDLRVRAPNQIFVSGMGLEAEWRTDMRITGTATAPSIVGRLEVVRGTYSFSGRRFELDRGIVTFQGAQFTNPALDIAASTSVEGVQATILIGGYAQAPRISFTSTPNLPQDEVLSRLLFGSSVASLSPTQAIQLAAALNSLRPGSGGGLNPLGKLRSVAGIDRLRVLGADQSAGRGTALAAGKYLTNNIYVEVITDARGFTATQLEISLSRALSVLSQAGSFGGSNVSVRYRKNY